MGLLTMHPRTAVALSGSTGADQRLRHGLGEHKPYRWRKTPGWNPAMALGAYRSKDRMARECPTCDALPGERCRNAGGRVMTRNTHDGR